MLVLQHGAPTDLTDRLEKEQKTYRFLEDLGIAFDRVDHQPAMTMEDCADIDAALGITICKNLFLCNRQKTQFYLLMIPDGKKFKTKELSSQLGVARLSFAQSEHMEELLDITPGSVSVMGLMNDDENRVQLLIDEDVLHEEYIGCHPCINTSSIKFKTDALMQTILPAMHHSPITVVLHPEEE